MADTASLTIDGLIAESAWADNMSPFFPKELWPLLRYMSPSQEVAEFYRTAREHGYVVVEQLADDLRNGTYSFSSAVVENAMRNPGGIDDKIADAMMRNMSGRVSEEAVHLFSFALEVYKWTCDNVCVQLNSLIDSASKLDMKLQDYIHRN